MELIILQSESANVEDCVMSIRKNSIEKLGRRSGKISRAKVELSFGAFMEIRVALLLDVASKMDKGVIVDYSVGRNREEAIKQLQEAINARMKPHYEVVDFTFGTYTTPVTRRTYAVGLVVYNAPLEKVELGEFGIKERRELLARALKLFQYNPKALNISEIARMFNVSRDSIYYDIEQILKEHKKD